MTILQRIAREHAVVSELVRAILLCAVVFGLPLTEEQTAAVLLVVGTVMALIVRARVTPASEVVADLKPGQIVPTAGPALEGVPNGDAVYVHSILGKA